MTGPQGEDNRIELIVALNRFTERMDALNKSGTHQTVTLSGGSFGIWVSVTCCLVMMATLAVGVPVAVGAYLDQQAEIRQLENTDNAIRAYINTGKMPPQPKEK